LRGTSGRSEGEPESQTQVKRDIEKGIRFNAFWQGLLARQLPVGAAAGGAVVASTKKL